MNDRLTILIIGYDGYSDLWNDCINLIKRFWTDCPFKILFVNNEMKKTWEGVSCIQAGSDAEWSKKVRIGLDAINTEYVCLLLEDFFVGEKIDNYEIQQLLKIMDDYSIDYLKLADLNKASKDYCCSIPNNKRIHKIKHCDDYGISLQAALWRKVYLSEKIGKENYNAWIFEFNQVKECNLKDKSYRPNALFDTRNILHLQHAVMQGKFIPSTIDYFKRRGYELSIEREIMSKSRYRWIRFVSFSKGIIPISLRASIKKLMEKMGFSFVSTVRDKGNEK